MYENAQQLAEKARWQSESVAKKSSFVLSGTKWEKSGGIVGVFGDGKKSEY